MSLKDAPSLYDILEISPNASSQDVKAAYHRTRATYSKSNVALYSLISSEEREEILQKIEEAYYVLSNPERRKEYDSHSISLGPSDNPFQHQEELPQEVAPVVSIDRVPPMETEGTGEDILIPPSTDFLPESDGVTPVKVMTQKSQTSPQKEPTPERPAQSSQANMSEIPLSLYRPPVNSRSYLPQLEPALLQEIEAETEWRGSFLKKIREAYKMPLEEMISHTRISRTYILAIEDENFAKLPAPVYIRGFVSQIAKILKLPHNKVAEAYLARYRLKRTSE